MSNIRLVRKVTIEQPVTGVIRDLVLFALFLQEKSYDNEQLVALAEEFWEREHGDDD